MARVIVPSFSAMLDATPSTIATPGMGAAIGMGLADALGGITAQAAANMQTKQLIGGFAAQLTESNPMQAQMYQNMANSLPVWGPVQGGGQGMSVPVRGSSGSPGGISMGSGVPGQSLQNMVMQDMLSTMDQNRKLEAEKQLAAVHFGYSMQLENKRFSNEETLMQDKNALPPTQSENIDNSIKLTGLGLKKQEVDETVEERLAAAQLRVDAKNEEIKQKADAAEAALQLKRDAANPNTVEGAKNAAEIGLKNSQAQLNEARANQIASGEGGHEASPFLRQVHASIDNPQVFNSIVSGYKDSINLLRGLDKDGKPNPAGAVRRSNAELIKDLTNANELQKNLDVFVNMVNAKKDPIASAVGNLVPSAQSPVIGNPYSKFNVSKLPSKQVQVMMPSGFVPGAFGPMTQPQQGEILGGGLLPGTSGK